MAEKAPVVPKFLHPEDAPFPDALCRALDSFGLLLTSLHVRMYSRHGGRLALGHVLDNVSVVLTEVSSAYAKAGLHDWAVNSAQVLDLVAGAKQRLEQEE